MLSNKVVVITGGAGRIGSKFLEGVVRNNGMAVLVDIDKKYSDLAIKKIELDLKDIDVKSKLVFKKVDISSQKEVFDLVRFVHDEFGKIDALVNNAYPKNKNYGKKFFEINNEDFSEFLTLHLGGYFNTSQQFVQYFIKQGWGNIINISSIQGVAAPAFETYEGTSMHSPVEYTVAKHGLIGLTKYMAKMFKKDGVRVNAISPGGILDRQPEQFLEQYKKKCGRKGMLDSDDIVGALLFLLSDLSGYVTGQNLIVDDGFCL